LAGGRKVAVFAAAGPSGDAHGDFDLDYDVNRSDLFRIAEELMEDRRGDVIRKIAVDAETVTSGELSEIELQNIARDDFDGGPLGGMRFDFPTQIFGEARVPLDGNDSAAPAGQQARHFAVTGADFEPDVVWIARQRFENPFLPGGVAEKMLTQFLTRHGERV